MPEVGLTATHSGTPLTAQSRVAAGCFERKACLVQRHFGRSQVHFFVTADEHSRASYNCHKEVSEFHKVIFNIRLLLTVSQIYKYTTFFLSYQFKKARGSVEPRAEADEKRKLIPSFRSN